MKFAIFIPLVLGTSLREDAVTLPEAVVPPSAELLAAGDALIQAVLTAGEAGIPRRPIMLTRDQLEPYLDWVKKVPDSDNIARGARRAAALREASERLRALRIESPCQGIEFAISPLIKAIEREIEIGQDSMPYENALLESIRGVSGEPPVPEEITAAAGRFNVSRWDLSNLLFAIRQDKEARESEYAVGGRFRAINEAFEALVSFEGLPPNFSGHKWLGYGGARYLKNLLDSIRKVSGETPISEAITAAAERLTVSRDDFYDILSAIEQDREARESEYAVGGRFRAINEAYEALMLFEALPPYISGHKWRCYQLVGRWDEEIEPLYEAINTYKVPSFRYDEVFRRQAILEEIERLDETRRAPVATQYDEYMRLEQARMSPSERDAESAPFEPRSR